MNVEPEVVRPAKTKRYNFCLVIMLRATRLCVQQRGLSTCVVAARRAGRPQIYRDKFSEMLIRGAKEQLERESRSMRRKGHVNFPQFKEHNLEQLQHWSPPWPKKTFSKPSVHQTVLARSAPQVKIVLLIIGGAGVYYVANLEEVPSTGRWRFNDIGINEERQMGIQAYHEALTQYRSRLLPESHPVSTQVRRVVSRIVNAAKEFDEKRAPGVHPTNWSVHVINDPQTNAFVLPGGKIFVFTGILPICGSDAGLATVLSHEVAHQLARHSAEKLAGYKILLIGSFVLNMLGLDFGLSRMALHFLHSCVDKLTRLPNSRRLETEADYLGLLLMAKACYDPHEAQVCVFCLPDFGSAWSAQAGASLMACLQLFCLLIQ